MAAWALLYILFEHKSAPDPFIVLQLLGYRREIWRRYAGTSAGKALCLPLIIPLVFYHGKQEWKVRLSITECLDADQELREFMSGMGYILCDLGQIPDNELASNAEVCAGLLPLKHVYRGTNPEVLLEAILPRLSDGNTYLEEQVIRQMIRLFPAITIELLTKVARRVKPHREGELISLAAKEWLRQGEEAGLPRARNLGFLTVRSGSLRKARPWRRQSQDRLHPCHAGNPLRAGARRHGSSNPPLGSGIAGRSVQARADRVIPGTRVQHR